MAGPGKEYVIGKGRLFFDQFLAGTKMPTGERYLGNTPELSGAQDIETLDHYDADQGLNVKDESYTIENTQTLTFATDNIDADNLALWFAGPKALINVASAQGLSEEHALFPGRFIQLGATSETPSGARNVVNVVVNTAAAPVDPEDPPVLTPIDPEGKFEFDLENGRVYVEPDFEVDDEATYVITYDVEASARTVVIGRGDEIRGALRFISANPIGGKRDYFWPYVKITPNGDYALKGNEWQQMSFSVEVLKKDGATERVYIDVAATAD